MRKAHRQRVVTHGDGPLLPPVFSELSQWSVTMFVSVVSIWDLRATTEITW